MACVACGSVIEEHNKTEMMRLGEWRPTKTENVSRRRRSYHLSSLYSPLGWFSWADIAEKFEKAQNDPAQMKTFVNTILGETFEEKGIQVSSSELISRVEEYESEILPTGVHLLTAGVDIQRDRIELEIVGWGAGEETWSIDYKILMGDTTADMVWQMLDMELMRQFKHSTGTMLRLARIFVYSSDQTQRVYDYTRVRDGIGVYACKGMAGPTRPLVPAKPSRVAVKSTGGEVWLYGIGVKAAKDLVMARLRLEEWGAGYCHFGPHNDEKYFKMLTVEKLVTRYDKKGGEVQEWTKPAGSRNEALDCRVYAMAAFYSMGARMDEIIAMFQGIGYEAPKKRSTRPLHDQ